MTHAYQLHNLRFLYGEKIALSLSDLTLDAGKVTALTGPNGCGKSTLLSLLAFMEAPNTGSITFFGDQVRPEQLFTYRKRVGFLPQKPYMLRGTVQDNLKLALKLRGTPKALWQKNINTALERLGIAHLGPQQVSKLSGGELQKSALARVLITDPGILLLDEPFSHMDQNSAQLLEQIIKGYQGTLIFSSHDRLHGLALANDVISLVEGARVKSALINLFHGCCANHIFNTGKINIILTSDIASCRHVSINPHEIVLSRQVLISSIRNQFQGRVMSISEEMGKVRIAVAAGEVFHVLITYEALHDLKLNLGDLVWVNFKSNSVTAF
ncbi:MAG: ATP-binding cassette domain-containing protein [Methylococcales bacterium]|nr:ATP-binding cassette domain-containing protein [Methylococcales bacterium]